MTNLKNLLIAVLVGLLGLSLYTLPAQSASKTYDAVKLAQYEHCLAYFRQANFPSGPTYADVVKSQISFCSKYRP